METREIKFRAWEEFPRYEIGDDGSVFSNDYNHSGKRKHMRTRPDGDGYPCVVFVVNGKRHKRVVHRMVAKLFIDNPENKPQVNHKNGIKSDNRVENLEWVTASENTIHGFRVLGRVTSDKVRAGSRIRFAGIKNPKAKLNPESVENIKALRESGMMLKEIAKIHGISVSQAGQIANNKFWKNIHDQTENYGKQE